MGNQPVTKFRSGNITATVWKNTQTDNEGKTYDIHSVEITRNYTDKEGKWQKTNSFKTNELHKVVLVTQKAMEHLLLNNVE